MTSVNVVSQSRTWQMIDEKKCTGSMFWLLVIYIRPLYANKQISKNEQQVSSLQHKSLPWETKCVHCGFKTVATSNCHVCSHAGTQRRPCWLPCAQTKLDISHRNTSLEQSVQHCTFCQFFLVTNLVPQKNWPHQIFQCISARVFTLNVKREKSNSEKIILIVQNKLFSVPCPFLSFFLCWQLRNIHWVSLIELY